MSLELKRMMGFLTMLLGGNVVLNTVNHNSNRFFRKPVENEWCNILKNNEGGRCEYISSESSYSETESDESCLRSYTRGKRKFSRDTNGTKGMYNFQVWFGSKVFNKVDILPLNFFFLCVVQPECVPRQHGCS